MLVFILLKSYAPLVMIELSVLNYICSLRVCRITLGSNSGMFARGNVLKCISVLRNRGRA
jgi:hypothetical protein